MLENGKKKKAIQMRDGYPVAVKSNLITETLGHQLVRRGLIDAGATTSRIARAHQAAGEGMQGEILVAMERRSTRRQVAEALSRHRTTRSSSRSSSWRSGGSFQASKLGKSLG